MKKESLTIKDLKKRAAKFKDFFYPQNYFTIELFAMNNLLFFLKEHFSRQ